jgi:urease accessory protein
MLDTAPQMSGLQRTRGAARVRLFARDRQTMLGGLGQAGSAKAMLPRTHGPAPEVVFLNTSGGVTGGDRLDYELALGAGARAVGTTQTAERAYRASVSAGGPGRLETRLRLGAGARLDWLPQEMILFEGSDTDRVLEVEMADDAELIALETLVFGRAAMGERLAGFTLQETRRVRRGGRLVVLEPLLLADAAREHAACLDGAAAIATLMVLARDAEDRLGTVREALAGLAGLGVTAAASAWDGKLIARFAAPAAWPLRRGLERLLPQVTGAPLPRVWQT